MGKELKQLLCPVCERARLRPFLQCSQAPVHQNLVVISQEAVRTVTRGELGLLIGEE